MHTLELRRRVQELMLHSAGGPFTPQQCEDALAASLLCIPPAQRSNLPDGAVDLLGRLAIRAGAPKDAPPSEVLRCIATYLETHPLPPTLLNGVSELVVAWQRDQAADRGRVAAQALTTSSPKVPLDQGVRPKGTIPAGPLAAFIASEKKP